jgi:hypothetical protein
MESLGGGERWEDRFLAKNSALLYYWANVLFYMIHPRGAYYMMSLIEDHAHKTYSKCVFTFMCPKGIEQLFSALHSAPMCEVCRVATSSVEMRETADSSRRIQRS